MGDRAFLSVFTPSRTPPEDLEAIFVQRQAMLADAVERVRESATTGSKHHLLFVGPRGTGKTHLVTLLVHRLNQDAALLDQLHIAWLNEDETSTSLLEFLRRIYLALAKRYPGAYREADLEPMYDMDPSSAESWLAQWLPDQLGDRTLLVVVENLDALFESLGEAGQQRLRAFIQERPVLSLVATAQRLVDDIAKRKNVFFGFFQVEPLQTLSVEEAAELLGKIASLNQDPETAAFLRSPTGRSRIRALHHLSGGNHRIYIVLSQFITRDNIDALVVPFAKMIDEMTPYYQERIRWLAPQQRKIVEFLCSRERPVPVKDLARRLFASQQTISSQLKDLRGKGYVQSAQRGREVLYEMAEPLMRICVEVKENQSPGPMRLLVDFLRVWYDEGGLSARLQKSEDGSLARTYLQAAIDRNSEFGNLRAQLLVEGFREEFCDGPEAAWLPIIELFSKASEEVALACGKWVSGNSDEALDILDNFIKNDEAQHSIVNASARLLAALIYRQQGAFEQIVNVLDPIKKMHGIPVEIVAKAYCDQGSAYENLGHLESAIANYNIVIELPAAPGKEVARALFDRGVIYGQFGNAEREIADYSSVIKLLDAPINQIARALFNRAVTYEQLGNLESALNDCNTIIDLSDVPIETFARTLLYRSVIFQKIGKDNDAISDYSAVIGLSEASVQQIAQALIGRGVIYGRLSEAEKAINDFSAVIGLPNLPTEQLATALYARGATYWYLRELLRAEADFEAMLQLAKAPVEFRLYAHFSLAKMQIASGRWEFALSSLTAGLALEGVEKKAYDGESAGIISSLFDST
ncbi:tetratricopeptide repeat protein, partial [Methylomagnum sp.]